MFQGLSGGSDERYAGGSHAQFTNSPTQLFTDTGMTLPRFSRGVGLRTRRPGQYTIRFSPAERQVIVDGMVQVTREEGRVTDLDERAVSH